MPLLDERRNKNEDESVGPAYTKMPRDAQRAAVDKTFTDLVKDAQQVKGSVFDTWTDAAIRQGTSDPHMGLSPQGMLGGAGVVVNPTAKEFVRAQAIDPGLAKAAQLVKPKIEYVQKLVSDFRKGVQGVTTGLPPAKLPAIAKEVEAGAQMANGPVRLSNEELKRLVQYSQEQPGSTLQAIRPNEDDSTVIHELLHSLYAAKDPLKMYPNVTPERGRELMTRVLNRTPLSMTDRFKIYDQYYKNPGHGLIEATAQYKVNKAAAKHGMNVK